MKKEAKLFIILFSLSFAFLFVLLYKISYKIAELEGINPVQSLHFFWLSLSALFFAISILGLLRDVRSDISELEKKVKNLEDRIQKSLGFSPEEVAQIEETDEDDELEDSVYGFDMSGSLDPEYTPRSAGG